MFCLSPGLHKSRVEMVVVVVPCSCHPCTREVEAGRSEALGPPRSHSKFESSLPFMRSYLKGNRNYFKSRIVTYKLYSCHSITRSITGRFFFSKSLCYICITLVIPGTCLLCMFFVVVVVVALSSSSPTSCQCLWKK